MDSDMRMSPKNTCRGYGCLVVVFCSHKMTCHWRGNYIYLSPELRYQGM